MITRLPRGPYRILPGPAGDVPWYMVSFDRHGRCSSPVTAAEVVSRVRDGGFSDVVVYSHGWNNDWREATDRYESFVSGYLEQAAAAPIGRPRRALLMGVFWPSKLLVGATGRGPQIAGDDPVAAVAEDRGDTDELGSTLPADAAARCYELLQREHLTEDEAVELVTAFLPLLHSDAAETAEPLPDAARLVAAWAADSGDTRPAPDEPDELDELGYFGDDATGPDAEPDVAGVAARLDPRQICWALSVWQMKDRAGAVGEHGVAPLLADLQRAGVRVHCVGHSYGAKVLLSAIATADLGGPVRSALLLQPAVSHLCFADAVAGSGLPGGYHGVPDRVELPVLSTFSSHDVPLRTLYHWALRRARDLGEPDVAAEGEPPSRYAALGGYGPRGLGAAAPLIAVADVGDRYPLGDGGVRVVGIDASATVDSHGGISNPSTWWMLRQLIHHGD